METEELKAITDVVEVNTQEGFDEVERFWRVFDTLTQEQRTLYLKFVWGRTRLPIDCSNISHKH